MNQVILFKDIIRPSNEKIPTFLMDLIDSNVYDINQNENEPFVIYYQPDINHVYDFSKYDVLFEALIKYHRKIYKLAPDNMIPQIKASKLNGNYTIYLEDYRNEFDTKVFYIVVDRDTFKSFLKMMTENNVIEYDANVYKLRKE